ncbi:methyl-accepting chemotaxis protein [Zobellella iuensis]|uniref:Cache domain-containing protein n=1 Tax=Zobellella iuensis TaxID=2803811 RepID=A0ABS1QSZ2_9GAMM|nr:methyl-accepting chemotaxis protein [Zobellella iuensis]MBL1377581.1 cache domain-containing protein [Zobellella iuensis]
MQQSYSLSIAARIWILLGVFALCLLFSIGVALRHSHLQLRDSTQHSAIIAVESAQGILNHYLQQERSGELQRQDAQSQAITHIEALRFDNGNYVFVHQDNGVAVSIVTSPQLNGQNIDELQDPTGVYIVRGIRQAAMNGGGFTHYQWGSPTDKNVLIDKTTYSAYFEPWGWIIGSGVNMGRLEQEQALVQKRFIITAILALVMMGGVSMLLIRSITRPLTRSVAAMRDLATGDGDLRRQLPETGPRELAMLARHFNQFTEIIRGIVQAVATAGGSLTQAACMLDGATKSTERAVQGQQTGTEQLAAAMNEMVQTVNEVARLAAGTAEATENASVQTAESRQVVSEAMISIGALATSLADASQAITRLEQQSSNIDQVLNVIRGIAEQTNLLALNAAIEAARAGEAGRGFAVVADEVRTLAQRTQESTSEIRAIIEELKSGTHQAVATMQEGVQQVRSSVELSGSVESSLEQIVTTIRAMQDIIVQIASATGQQVAAAEEINQSVIVIRDQSSEVAGEAGNTSRATKELSGIAERMSALIARFNIQ